MTRSYSPQATAQARRQLAKLLEATRTVDSYRDAMTDLGRLLGRAIAARLDPRDRVVIACTVEDADYLARGLLDVLEETLTPEQVSFACFWNERVTVGKREPREQAPIVRRYVEPHPSRISAVVMVKSIISTACVVKTNLIELLEHAKPRHILIAAPVMVEGATTALESEFPSRLASRFEYVFFARDTEVDSTRMVRPGIGGSVYELLGVGTKDTKNDVNPTIVTERRRRFSSREPARQVR